jgi:hypothetical protein
MEKPTDSSRGEKRKCEGEEQADKELSWVQIKCSEADLQELVEKYLLQPKSVIHWRSALGEVVPIARDS